MMSFSAPQAVLGQIRLSPWVSCHVHFVLKRAFLHSPSCLPNLRLENPDAGKDHVCLYHL